MKTLNLLWFAIAFVSCFPAGNCEGQSLWNRRSSSYGHLFFDTQARCVGDTVTVLVRESTDVANRDERKYDRKTNASGGFKFNYGFTGKLGNESGSAAADVGVNGKGDFSGNSKYTVDREFSDRITATVVGRFPNGNLEIRGERVHYVSGERRALVVTGIIRPLDIRANNTIESQFIANFNICYDGDGRESRFTKEGWFTKAWNKYRPL